MRFDLVFPRFKLLSGAERAILGLAAALVEAGHGCRIVCHQFHESCRPRLAPGVELVCSGARLDWSRNRYLNAVSDYARTFGLRRLLDAGADAQVFFGPALPLAWQRARFAAGGAAVVYYCWEPPRVLYQDRETVLRRLGLLRWPMAVGLAAYRALDRRMVGAVDAVVTSSPFAARRIGECYGRPASPITLGIDRARLDAARQRRDESPPLIVTVNYLHPRKRVDLAIDAMAELARRRDLERARLIVVGDGPERRALEERVAARGLGDRVELVGFVADDELPGFYWRSSCYVHTTLEESFGLSVIEASYCGRPVVAVDEGGVRDTVDDGVTGYRVAATPAALADGLARVLGSANRGASLGAAGREKISAEFRWERGAEELVSLVQRPCGPAAEG